MKKYYLLITLSLLLIDLKLIAQKNIIDVPISEIVEKGDYFFQEEILVSNRYLRNTNIITWGFGKKFEGGINLQQLTFNTRPKSKIITIDSEEPENNPDLLINLQKGFTISNWMLAALGTQSGISPSRQFSKINFPSFSYLNTQLSIPDKNHLLVLGGYLSNEAFSGEGNKIGLMGGMEGEIWKDKLSIIGDFFSGKNSMSSINLGLEIILPKRWQIDFAVQLPFPGSDNNHGIVFQVNRK